MKKKLKEKKIFYGFTLTELLVSVTLFTIIMLTSIQIFMIVLQAQRRAVAVNNVQESLKFSFEVTSKEIRTAIKDSDDQCPFIEENKIFKIENNNTLYLRNQYGQCVKYYLDEQEGRFRVERENVSVPLSPSAIIIDDLKFRLTPKGINNQAYINFNVLAKSVSRDGEEVILRLQTSIASRYYRED